MTGPGGSARGLVLDDVRLEHGGACVHLVLERGLAAWILESRAQLRVLHRALAGLDPPRGGRVSWGGRDPYRSPGLRARLGHLLPEEASPGGSLRVGDFLDRARRARLALSDAPGFPAAEPTGVPLPAALAIPGGWRERRLEELNVQERRRIALTLALETPRPLGLALHEPFAAVETEAEPALFEALAAHAAAGHPVLVTTTSSSEAARLSSAPLRFTPAREHSIALLLRVDRPDELARSLRGDPAVSSVHVDPTRPGEVLLFGEERQALARAATRSVHELRVELSEMSFVSAQGTGAEEGGHEP